MNNDLWRQQQGNNAADNGEVPQPGSLSRDYHRQQGLQWDAPTFPPTQGPPSYSPLPQGQAPFSGGRGEPKLVGGQGESKQEWPSQQTWPSPPQEQGWVSNTVQMVRRWSGRLAAIPPPVDQNPLVLYRPGTAPLPLKSKPWKRSRAVRVAMQMKHRRARWKRSRPNARAICGGVVIAFFLLMVITISSGSAYAYGYYQSQLPRLQGLANQQIEQTTRIYDRNGTLLFDLYNPKQGGGRRTPISYKYIPKILQDAMVAAEDHTFWTNIGIDPQGIIRAATEYAQKNSVQGGGSTITQQLIKNLSGETTLSLNRKIPEAALAIGLTQQFPKWKILEMYFNVSSFGAQDLGVEAAIEDYFHLKPNCGPDFNCTPAVNYLDVDAHGRHDPLLGLARASLLAGLPQNPVSFDPTLGENSKQRALVRQDEVLGEMLGLGMQVQGLGPITQNIVDQAEALTAKMTFTPYNRHIRCGHFVYWVIDQLSAQLSSTTLLTGGFNIRTTIDANLEDYVERAVQRHLDQQELQPFGGGYGPLNIVNNVNDSAVVVMNAKNGEVLAMNGSANYFDRSNPSVSGQTNMAVQPRQPGSSFKPIVYATAFQMGWYPGIVLTDQKTTFPNGNQPFTPADYGGGYHNAPFSIRLAIANSFNIPAVKAFEYAGPNNVINMARRFGISPQYLQYQGPSMALGTSAIPLIQMVGAYQVFANQGSRVPPRSVLDIWDNYGHHLYHYDPTHPGGVQVISPQIAYLMTSILSDEYARQIEFWPDHVLSFWNNGVPEPTYPDVSAKTGTTDSFKDNWTIGYTSDVVVGVWSGNADDKLMRYVIGITGAAPIWHSVMARVNGICTFSDDQIPCGGNFDFGFRLHKISPPAGLVQQCVSSSNGLQGTGNCSDLMIDGEQPQQSGFNSDNNGNNNPTPTPTP